MPTRDELIALRERVIREMHRVRPVRYGSLNDAARQHHDRLVEVVTAEFTALIEKDSSNG